MKDDGVPAAWRAIADALIAGRRGAAMRLLDAVPAEEQHALDGFLDGVWGVGRAPRPPRRPPILVESPGSGDRYGARWLRRQYQQRWLAWRVVRAPDPAAPAAERQAFGSAAVVHGGWFRDDLADRSFVLTNAHVCRTDAPRAGEPEPIAPRDAALDWRSDEETWGAAGAPGFVRVVDVLWSSPPDALDATLLEVEPLPAEARPPADAPGRDVLVADRCYLWGYPILDDEPHLISLSPDDNAIVDAGETHFSYFAFAAPGSSGAPVFHQKTHALIGLHRGERRADGRRHAVYLELILRAARAHLAR